jgi:hypothetical protein
VTYDEIVAGLAAADELSGLPPGTTATNILARILADRAETRAKAD